MITYEEKQKTEDKAMLNLLQNKEKARSLRWHPLSNMGMPA